MNHRVVVSHVVCSKCASSELESDNGLKNVGGTIAMAREAAPDTATSEYFVNIEANPRLDYTGPDHLGYAVFGRIVEGMNVVDKIKAVETRANPTQN